MNTFTIIHYEPNFIERGCCGDHDRIITEASCFIEIHQDPDEAARALFKARSIDGETILLINGKQFNDGNYQEIDLRDCTDSDLTPEETTAANAIDNAALNRQSERAAALELERKKKEAEEALRRERLKEEADRKIKEQKMKQYLELKKELQL